MTLVECRSASLAQGSTVTRLWSRDPRIVWRQPKTKYWTLCKIWWVSNKGCYFSTLSAGNLDPFFFPTVQLWLYKLILVLYRSNLVKMLPLTTTDRLHLWNWYWIFQSKPFLLFVREKNWCSSMIYINVYMQKLKCCQQKTIWVPGIIICASELYLSM